MQILTIGVLLFYLPVLAAVIVFIVWFIKSMNAIRRSVTDINYKLDFVMRNMASGAGGVSAGIATGANGAGADVGNASEPTVSGEK